MTKNILKLFLISFLFSANIFAMKIEKVVVPEKLINLVIEVINLKKYKGSGPDLWKMCKAETKIKKTAEGKNLTDEELNVIATSVQNKLEEGQDRVDKEEIKRRINTLFVPNASLSNCPLNSPIPYPNLNRLLIKISISLNKEDKSINLDD